MAEKKIDLSKLTYAQLEAEANATLTKLGDENLPLDEASKVYSYGKLVAAEMEKRLSELEKSVSDTVSRD